MDKLIIWWQGHQPREQLVLAGVAAAFIAFLAFMFVVDPVLSWQTQAQQRLAKSATELQQVKQLAAHFKAQQASSVEKLDNKGLATTIDSSLRKNTLVMRGFQPGTKNDARLRLENAPYSSLIQWLHDLEYQHHISVQELSLTPATAPGHLIVSLRVSQ